MGTVKSVHLKVPATLLAVGIALAATPALSQGAMGPGGAGAPMAPQPRVAPPPPVVAPPVAPQAPVPMALPNPSVPSPKPAGEPAKAIIGGTVIAGNGAPKVLSPANGATVGGPDSKTPIAFRWTAPASKTQEPVTYTLKVWQLMQGQNGTQAMATNQPVVTKDVDNLPQMSIASPNCSQGTCSFVWSVQALNRDGKPVGENNGTSDPSGFKTAGAVGGGTTTNPGTSQPAGIKGTTAIVAILALQTNNDSTSIFDRWGNLFVEQKGNTAAPNLSIVSTDRSRGSVTQATTDQKGLFKVASTPGVHEFTLPAKDIETAYAGVAGGNNGSPTPQAMHGSTAIVAILAFKVPGATTGGGRQDFGLARAIPHGASSMQVKLAVNSDGTVSTVDWNDGAGPQPVNREGKPMGSSSGPGEIPREIVGRTLFVGEAPKKQ